MTTDAANKAISHMHEMLASAMTVQGMVCLRAVDVLAWTMKHAGAINEALEEQDREASHD